ncbi:MAG: hypothetical protein ACRCY2_10520 [Bombilactobacillus sp.]
MLKIYNQKFQQTLNTTFQNIYPLILIDAYLRLLKNTLLTSNGFFKQIFHLQQNFSIFNHLCTQYLTILELLILLFFGYLLTQNLSNFQHSDLNFSTVLILAVACMNIGPDLRMTWTLPSILLVIIISYLVAYLFRKVPWPTIRIILAFLVGYIINLIQQNDIFVKLPGISTSARNINWWSLGPLVMLRNLATWLGIINPFTETRQSINSPAATANLSAALTHRNLNNLPFPFNLHSIYTSYAFLGGIGCTLGLIFALLILHKDRLVLQNILLSLFGFNAPLLFKLPVLFNLWLVIPFVISPILSMLIGALFIQLKWAQPAVYEIFSGTPTFLLNFLGTNGNWGSLIATILAIVCSTAIYLPFIKAEAKYENKNLD